MHDTARFTEFNGTGNRARAHARNRLLDWRKVFEIAKQIHAPAARHETAQLNRGGAAQELKPVS